MEQTKTQNELYNDALKRWRELNTANNMTWEASNCGIYFDDDFHQRLEERKKMMQLALAKLRPERKLAFLDHIIDQL